MNADAESGRNPVSTIIPVFSLSHEQQDDAGRDGRSRLASPGQIPRRETGTGKYSFSLLS